MLQAPPRSDDIDYRALPMYAAGSVDVPFVIAGNTEVMTRETHWATHSHPTHELLWNARGASSATVGSRVWTLTPTIALWIPAGVPHSGWAPADTVQRAAHFSFDSVPTISTDPVSVEVTPLLRLLLDRLHTAELDAASRSLTEAMVLDVLEPARHPLLLQMPTSGLLDPIVDTLQRDPSDDTTLAAWAVRLSVSTRTITRTFHAQTGLGFGRWVATLRAQRAITLLAQGIDIDEVATAVGYLSTSAFGTAFRRVTGMSPGRFRSL